MVRAVVVGRASLPAIRMGWEAGGTPVVATDIKTSDSALSLWPGATRKRRPFVPERLSGERP